MLEPQEYIRKYGIKKAREYYDLIKDKPLFSFDADMPSKYRDMIASHDYIDNLGGMMRAKDILKKEIRLENAIAKGKVVIESVSFSERIKFHIKVVESCQ